MKFADFHYKVSAPYRPELDQSLLWNDETINVQWPLIGGICPTVSVKDSAAKTFKECEKHT